MNTIDTYINEARKWLGTPFRLHARVLGHGVDCNTLVFEAVVSIGIKYDPNDRGPYRLMEHNDPGPGMAALFEQIAMGSFTKVQTQTPQRGDVIAFRIGGKLQHVSIAINQTRHLHVCHVQGVIEDEIEPSMLKRIAYVYRFTGEMNE